MLRPNKIEQKPCNIYKRIFSGQKVPAWGGTVGVGGGAVSEHVWLCQLSSKRKTDQVTSSQSLHHTPPACKIPSEITLCLLPLTYFT